ncbi:retrotransposon ORF1 [Tanacetum coccineum]
MGDENPIRTLGDYSKPSHEGYRNTIELPEGNNVVHLRSNTIRERTRLPLFQFSLRDQASNWLECLPAGSISTWEDLTTRFLAQFFPPGRTAKLNNNILMFQQHHGESLSEAWTHVLSTSDCRLIELENQVHHLMEAHLALIQPTQVNKITTPCEICSGPHDAQNCMENPEQGFVEYASSRTDEAGDDDEPQNEGPHKGEGATKEEPAVEYFDTFPTKNELTYHRYLMSGPIPLIFLRNPIITEGCPYNLKIPCNIGHVHIDKAYIDLNSPFNIMTRMMYNWFMRRKLDPREDANGGISNFIGRIKGMHVFVGNFTYVVDFMIVEDISSIIDPRLSQVVLGSPFIEISNMTHDPPEGVVRFIRGVDEVAYKMPHKIEQYDSLSDLEKEHTKSVYLRNEEDRRRGVKCVMSKILGFYKECLKVEAEYLTRMDDEVEVTLCMIRRSLEVLRKFHWMILGGRFNQLSHVSSSLLSKLGEY